MSTNSTERPVRLSVSTHTTRPPRPLSETELATLRAVADCLIPAVNGHRSGSAVETFEELVTRAAALLGAKFVQLVDIVSKLATVQADELWDVLKTLSQTHASDFYVLSMTVSAAYLYSREMQAELGYPRPHQNPFGLFDVADELETGILDPVMERGKTYVAP